jgi:hypothetical protein
MKRDDGPESRRLMLWVREGVSWLIARIWQCVRGIATRRRFRSAWRGLAQAHWDHDFDRDRGRKILTFDARRYAPEPNGWLRIAARHPGRATLRFDDPAGSVEGDAELTYEETGEVRIEVRLDPSSLREEGQSSGGLLPFIQPGRNWESGGSRITARNFGDRLNPCSCLWRSRPPRESSLRRTRTTTRRKS